MKEPNRVPQPRRPEPLSLGSQKPQDRVVVGVDGSPASVQALVWALRYGAEQDCVVWIVTAWPLHSPVLVKAVPGHFSAARWKAAEVQAEAIAHALSLVASPPTYTSWLENGPPHEVLVRAAGPGDLLVLGSDRATQWAEQAAGPVREVPLTIRVQRHAHCPVLLIPHRPAGELATVKSRALSIQDFLLARTEEQEVTSTAAAHVSATSGGSPQGEPTKTVYDHLRSVISGHHERSMRITAIQGVETFTRCVICVGEKILPCVFLRTLAQPYRGHADYDTAWDLAVA